MDAGPAGPERFEAGVAGYEARAFRGLGVFSSMPYETSDGMHQNDCMDPRMWPCFLSLHMLYTEASPCKPLM